MNISGIRTYAGFYDYNTIKSQEAYGRQIAESKTETEAAKNVNTNGDGSHDEAAQVIVAPKKSDNGASEYAKQYQPDVTYELKGEDSDIASLDVQRALSDMKKDQVLQQYQFFVGESSTEAELTKNREDENFYL